MADDPFVLDGFEPLERIGGGGFGEVWLARQANIDRRVAVKVGHAPIDDQTVQIRFERECIALGRLSGHPNIVDVFTAGQMVDGRPYLVLEYVNGGTLWQRLQARPLAEPELIKIGVELAAALSVAHGAGVLHRDLKPENVLLRANGDAVLGDFGIARLHDGANTTSHAITASVAYAPPEILAGGSSSVASDIYGIGICLLAGAIRSVPFVASTDQSIHPIINRVLTDKPPDLRQHGISSGLEDLIRRLLAKDPVKRPQTAEQVGQELENLLLAAQGITPPAPPAILGPGIRARSTGPITGPLRAAAASTGSRASGRLVLGSTPAPHLAPPSFRLTTIPTSRAARIRVLGAAFGASLLVGGLLLFALIKLLGSGSGSETPAPTTDPGGSTASGLPRPPDASATDPDGLTSLALPITASDLQLGSDVVVLSDPAGPGAAQYCDNVPATTGLVDYVGQTISSDAGLPAIFQSLSRFTTPAEAGAYVEAYMATLDCEDWTIESTNGEAQLVLHPVAVAPTDSYGDDTRALSFQGGNPTVTIHGRAAIVRRSTDVFLLSITATTTPETDELDRLLPLAVPQLGS